MKDEKLISFLHLKASVAGVAALAPVVPFNAPMMPKVLVSSMYRFNLFASAAST
jgi:hypothetical protein